MAISLKQAVGRAVGTHMRWLMKPFNCPQTGVSAVVCGWLGGSIAGAKLAAMCARDGRVSRGECLRLGWLCTVCSPAFALGALECALPGRGWTLLISSWLGTLAGSLLLRRAGGDVPVQTESRADDGVLAPVTEAARAMLAVGCYVVLMSVLSAYVYMGALIVMPGVNPAFPAVVHALLEMAGGALTLCELPGAWVMPLVCFAITFGGVSISLQALAFLRPLGVSAWAYMGGKALQGALAALICALITRTDALCVSTSGAYVNVSGGFEWAQAATVIAAVALGTAALLLNKRYIEYENADDAERAQHVQAKR